MRLRVKNGHLTIEQSPEERVILHLDAVRDTPNTMYDQSGYKRTANGIAAATGIPYPSMAKLLCTMRDDGTVELHSLKYRTDQRQGNVYALVYLLTPDGQKLAYEIRERLA
ncbi:MAG: hypothetical protein A4E30_00280 [Methanomassiliicoccales archaeon PtaB.Bin215]|nr:MAG: hypothetical protein A4E30_00280 [Methanomassiliicoccales archaeon PtaB.Bin215]